MSCKSVSEPVLLPKLNISNHVNHDIDLRIQRFSIFDILNLIAE